MKLENLSIILNNERSENFETALIALLGWPAKKGEHGTSAKVACKEVSLKQLLLA